MSKGRISKIADRSNFRRTAIRTRKINIRPRVMRGGTRL